MAVATHLPTDGEYVVLGDFENHPDAIIFRDLSGTQIVINAPSGDDVNWGIGDTSEMVLTALHLQQVNGNFRAGPVNAFATTEPTQALVMEAGTAPAGAITTSGGLFSSATVVRKIIAAGTVSNVET